MDAASMARLLVAVVIRDVARIEYTGKNTMSYQSTLDWKCQLPRVDGDTWNAILATISLNHV